MKKYLYLDVKAQKTADEVGGFTPEDTRKRGLSVAVTFCASTGVMTVYLEKDVSRLLSQLKQADVVVGYNLKRFDLEVLSAYPGADLADLKVLDLMERIVNAAKCRVSLGSLLTATFGMADKIDGNELIEAYKEGDINKVIHACCSDVLGMWRLHQHGLDYGEVTISSTKTIRAKWD